MATQEKILVSKLSALGDFVQALGPMAAIRAHHPHAEITLLTTDGLVSFAVASAYFNRVWVDRRPRWHDLKGWLDLRRQLNDGKFSRVYDLQNNDRTALYFRLMTPRPEWVGIAKGASHRNIAPDRAAGHAFDGHVQTLGLAGIRDITVDKMDWVKNDTDRFALQKPYVLLVPGCAPSRPEKRWPADDFSALAGALCAQDYQPVIIGTQDETDIAAQIRRTAPEVLDLTGKTTLFDIVALGRHAVAAIGNDTGPMHLIAPTGCPSYILFSRHSNPVRHAPKGEAVRIIQAEELANLSPETVMKHLDFLKNKIESKT